MAGSPETVQAFPLICSSPLCGYSLDGVPGTNEAVIDHGLCCWAGTKGLKVSAGQLQLQRNARGRCSEPH